MRSMAQLFVFFVSIVRRAESRRKPADRFEEIAFSFMGPSYSPRPLGGKGGKAIRLCPSLQYTAVLENRTQNTAGRGALRCLNALAVYASLVQKLLDSSPCVPFEAPSVLISVVGLFVSW
jgi:hypothetical protein